MFVREAELPILTALLKKIPTATLNSMIAALRVVRHTLLYTHHLPSFIPGVIHRPAEDIAAVVVGVNGTVTASTALNFDDPTQTLPLPYSPVALALKSLFLKQHLQLLHTTR